MSMKRSIIAALLAILIVSTGLGYLAIARPRVEFELIQEPGMGATESPHDILIVIHFEITDMIFLII